jgi:hypothetical protein
MEFFAHQTIKKYTLALLDTFNDIKVERKNKSGTPYYITVPITFGSKNKAFVLSQQDVDQWKTGNTNFLPRMSLSLLTMLKDNKRDTNRLHKIHKSFADKSATFQYNAVAYTFTFELALAALSLTELSMMLEQLLTRFNPSVRINVMEMLIQDEPSSLPVNLLSVDVDLPSNLGPEDDIRIVNATLMLELKGNIYQPFTDSALIEQVRLYMNPWYDDKLISEERRSVKYELSVEDGVVQTTTKTDFADIDTIAKNPPVLAEINGLDTVLANSQNYYTAIFSDVDDELNFTYIWNILSGNATKTGTGATISVTPTTVGTVLLQCQVIDRDGNVSNFITKTITVE